VSEEIDHESKVPVWRQLADILRSRIESGRYPPGRRIASKAEAMQEFGIGDKTYDKAVAQLRDEGLIETIRGKGSYVSEPA
jgi:GntR family transcriptional regulator